MGAILYDALYIGDDFDEKNIDNKNCTANDDEWSSKLSFDIPPFQTGRRSCICTA